MLTTHEQPRKPFIARPLDPPSCIDFKMNFLEFSTTFFQVSCKCESTETSPRWAFVDLFSKILQLDSGYDKMIGFYVSKLRLQTKNAYKKNPNDCTWKKNRNKLQGNLTIRKTGRKKS